ncbi:MAG TPA: FAD-dependent oxidoreductase [Devosia sp.]|nr:FAD-dependent oxidoreductase [Devosia sp.]
MRLSRPGIWPTSQPVRFSFDGEVMTAQAGETIAAALAANGVKAFRNAEECGDAAHAKRGLYCGMGTCYECIVTVDGKANQRACMSKINGGEDLRSAPPNGAPGDTSVPLTPLAVKEVEERSIDVLIIGAGPAGLSAAVAARKQSASVVVLDERLQSGGQYFKPVAPSLSVSKHPDAQFRRGAELELEARTRGAEIIQATLVWGALSATEVLALVGNSSVVFRPRKLILATGAYERPVAVPGWTLPGVMTTGAGQTLVRSYGVTPGQRIIIAGNGPLNLQLAVELLRFGVKVLAVVESAKRPSPGQVSTILRALYYSPNLIGQGMRYLAELKLAGIPILWEHAVRSAQGQDRVQSVDVARIDEDGSLDEQHVRRFDVDSLCMGYGFISSSELARGLGCDLEIDHRHLGSQCVKVSESHETTVPGVFAVGDGARVNGAQFALASGTIAGASAAGQLGRGECVDNGLAAARKESKKAEGFQKALWELYKSPPVNLSGVPDDTLLCRCESLSFGQIRNEISQGWDTLGTIKRRTRMGMGRCQGRNCVPTANRLITECTGRPLRSDAHFAPRLPVKPFPAAALTIEKGEWGGHARAPSPDLSRPVLEPSLPDIETEIVVIGGGVVGSCLAYYLSKAGKQVVVVERDDANLQASGANAGSLHVQLLSFDFGDKAVAGGGPAAATLPLGPWSVELWQDIAELSADNIEIAISGGLMVAETEAGLAFLKSKAELERSYGIEAEILSQNELRAMAPHLAHSLIGAEYSPQEGKINPLSATMSVLKMARAQGAQFLRSTNVLAIERSGNAWTVTTSRTNIRAAIVVNAAGPWARNIGAMVGIDVPVYSAPLQMIVTERAPKMIEQLIAHADRHLSMKQLSSGGLLIGGAWPGEYNHARRLNATTRSSVEGNLWVAQRVVPQLASLHILRTWAGMNVDIDGAPIIGEAPGVPNFYNCVTSNGYTLAPAVAKLTTEFIEKKGTSKDTSAFRLERFN